MSESPAHQQALTQLADRIQRKRLKATRGSDTLQVVVTASGSSGAGQEARPAAGGGLWAYLTGTCVHFRRDEMLKRTTISGPLIWPSQLFRERPALTASASGIYVRQPSFFSPFPGYLLRISWNCTRGRRRVGSDQSKQPEPSVAAGAAITVRLLRREQVESSETKRTPPSNPSRMGAPAPRNRVPSSGPPQPRAAPNASAVVRGAKIVTSAPAPSPPIPPRRPSPGDRAQLSKPRDQLSVTKPAAEAASSSSGGWFSSFARRTPSAE